MRILPLTFLVFLAPLSLAGDVQVRFEGSVEFNQIGSGVLGQVQPGDMVSLIFELDSSTFVDSASFPVRGYPIDRSSFSLDFGGGNQIGLQDPFPGGQEAYFSVRNDDPAVDGFFLSTLVDFPVGVPLDQNGVFSQFQNNVSVTYVGSTLTSLDIADAFGSYDFGGLTVFNWTVDDGPFQPLGIVFSELQIGPVGPVSDCEPLGGNSVSATGASLSSTGGYLGPQAGFSIEGTPDEFGILFSGSNDAGQVPFGCATRCVGGGVVRYGPFQANGNALQVTIDMSVAPGNTRVQWWYRDPGNLAVCGSSFSLSNALGL